MTEQKYSLYIATNVVNGMQYVGLAKTLRKRWASHKHAGTNSAFHKAIKHYGHENFVFSHIADAFDLESARMLERALIAQHNTYTPNGYNSTIGGQVGFIGKHSDETKAKISAANVKRNQQVKDKFAKSQLGMVRNDDFRSNASAKMKEVWAKRKQAKEAANIALSKIKNMECSND
jgi:group I intron endonuclease